LNDRASYLERKRQREQRSADVKAKAMEAKLAKEAAMREKMALAKKRKEPALAQKISGRSAGA
jgi:hypothetical protein